MSMEHASPSNSDEHLNEVMQRRLQDSSIQTIQGRPAAVFVQHLIHNLRHRQSQSQSQSQFLMSNADLEKNLERTVENELISHLSCVEWCRFWVSDKKPVLYNILRHLNTTPSDNNDVNRALAKSLTMILDFDFLRSVNEVAVIEKIYHDALQAYHSYFDNSNMVSSYSSSSSSDAFSPVSNSVAMHAMEEELQVNSAHLKELLKQINPLISASFENQSAAFHWFQRHKNILVLLIQEIMNNEYLQVLRTQVGFVFLKNLTTNSCLLTEQDAIGKGLHEIKQMILDFAGLFHQYTAQQAVSQSDQNGTLYLARGYPSPVPKQKTHSNRVTQSADSSSISILNPYDDSCLNFLWGDEHLSNYESSNLVSPSVKLKEDNCMKLNTEKKRRKTKQGAIPVVGQKRCKFDDKMVQQEIQEISTIISEAATNIGKMLNTNQLSDEDRDRIGHSLKNINLECRVFETIFSGIVAQKATEN